MNRPPPSIYLFLGKTMVAPSSSSMTRAVEAAANARNVVVFTGAGMSADSGVHPFRGENGAWNGGWGKLALVWGGTPMGWKWTPGWVWGRFVTDFYGPIAAAKPHAGHRALQEWKESGNLDSFAYITMNVDGLHQASGATNEEVAEVHGSVMKYRCMSCDQKMSNLLQNEGLDPQKQPRCDACGGRARPDVTLFTEALPGEEWERAVDFIGRLETGDVMIVAGTSSVVYPAASLPEYAKQEGATIIEFNLDFPTPLSSIADIAVQGRAAETLPQFVTGVMEKRSNKK
jgi:NAD-dependent deacetylase